MSKNNILKRLSPIHLVALICAVVIFATVVVSSIFYIRNEVKGAKREFDYTKETLTDYITLGEYENLTVTPEYNKIRPVDVQSSILTLIAGEKNHSSAENASYNTATKITVGDVVNLYYRGYVIEEDGTRNYMDGMSNLGGTTYATMKSYSLSIGADTFIPGFALSLEGDTVGQYPKMEVSRDVVTENDIAFVSYTRYPMTTNKYSKVETQGTVETKTAVLVDLTLGKDKINATYGEGVYELLVGAKADGEKNLVSDTTKGVRCTVDGVNYKYTSIKVEYKMAANYYEGKEPIEVEFPANYSSTDLAGKTAYFQIIIESVKEYSFKVDEKDVEVTLSDKATVNTILEKALEDNDDFAEYLNGLTEEEKSVGYYELYTKYLFAKDEEDYAIKYENALYQAIIDAIVEGTTVKADHPELEAKYNASLITFRESYAENGSSYATIEEYAEAVIGGDEYYVTVYMYQDENGNWKVLVDKDGNAVAPGADDTTEYTEREIYDWKAAVKQLSVDYFTERMAIHQIIKDKNLAKDGAYDAAYAKVCDMYSKDYRASYCNSNGIDIDDMTVQEEQQVDAAVKSYLQSSLGYEYLADRAYYQLVLDYIIENTNLTINE